MIVTIGPQARLHRGYHGALLSHPPGGVEYVVADPTAEFVSYVSTRDFVPCDHFAVLERHRYEGHPRFVHSVHFPVANERAPWALETDSLLAHLQYGHVIAHPAFRAWLQDARTHPIVAERLANMLELVAAPGCVALIFHSRGQLRRNREQCLSVMPPAWATLVDGVFAKAVVCYPAQPSGLTEEQRRARTANRRRGVVFAASAFEHKGGRVTLELYRRLLTRDDVELCYFGPLPASAAREFGDVLTRIHYAPQVSRELLLEFFGEAHILVFPSRHEALGVTLFEALAHGLAIVTTRGPGLENVAEVIEDGVGGILIHTRSLQHDPPVDDVHQAVVALLENRDRYDAMSRHNLSLFEAGPFSLRRRDETLLEVYRRSAAEAGPASAHRPGPTNARHDARRLRYSLPFSTVAALSRTRLARTLAPTESGLLVPELGVADGFERAVAPDQLQMLSDLAVLGAATLEE